MNETKNTAATATVRRMRGTGKWRFKGADAEELAAELASLIGARHRQASNDAAQWVVDPRTIRAEVER